MRIDHQGRVLIPREVREHFRWADGFDMALSQDGGQIILTPQRGRECSCCLERKKKLWEFMNLCLCDDCLNAIVQCVQDENS